MVTPVDRGLDEPIEVADERMTFNDGSLVVQATLAYTGEITVGAVHIADHDTGLEAVVKSDGTDNALTVRQNSMPSLVAGTALVGKVGIDQTTPGTTNKVSLGSDAVAVTGTFYQTTQPVSIATMPTTPVTGTFYQATQPVSGTFWQTTQPVDLADKPARDLGKVDVTSLDQYTPVSDKLPTVAYVRTGTSTYQIPMSDPMSHVQAQIDFIHYKTHSGNSFYLHDVLALANAASQDYIITVPNTTLWPHLTLTVDFHDGAGSVLIYETSDRVGTTLQAMLNRDRNSATGATTTIHKNHTGGTTDGSLIFWKRTGAGKSIGGQATTDQERILKQNTKYLLRVTNNTVSTNNVSVVLRWYEHTNTSA